MADDESLACRRELLEWLYELLLTSPQSQGLRSADPSDPEDAVRAREAEYLRRKGYLEGTIGAHGDLALRLTPLGRDYVEAGGFWGASPAPAPPADPHALDRYFASMAIEEARKSKAEDERQHPMVGAIVVREGKLIGKAHRGELGEGDHGEFTVLEKKLADKKLVGATIYVTLEPCTTRQHPKVCCAARLLERKVARVVIGMVDPDPRISGRGITTLRKGRIDIGFFPEDLAAEVEELNRHWVRSIEEAAKAAGTGAPSAPPVPQANASKEAREHDKNVFAKSDALMSEVQLRNVLEMLLSDHGFMLDDDRPLTDWARFFEFDSNQYLIESLRTAAQLLHNKLKELDVFIATNFFLLGSSKKLAMHPSLNVDRGGSGDPDDVLRYDQYGSQLFQLGQEVSSLYSSYRKAVKEQLFI